MNNDRIYYSHDAEVHALHDRTMLVVLCLTLGLGIGAAIALLFAPTTGKVIRHQISDTVEDNLQNGRNAVDPMVKRVEEKLQNGRDALDPMVKRVEDEFDELKNNVKEHLK